MPISLRLDDELEKRLDNLAQASGRSKTRIIQDCIRDRIEDWEDIYLSLKRLECGEKMWSMEQVEERYDLNN